MVKYLGGSKEQRAKSKEQRAEKREEEKPQSSQSGTELREDFCSMTLCNSEYSVVKYLGGER